MTTTTAPLGHVPTPDEAVVINCDFGFVELMYASPPSDERLQTARHVDLEQVGHTLELSMGYPDCSGRGYFNQDFSMFMTAGSSESGAQHVVVIDLATGEATDITEARQGSGFSGGGPLEETPLTFEPEAHALRYSNRVVVTSGADTLIVDPDDPTATEAFPGGYDAAAAITRASGVDFYDGDGHSRSIVSPDGRFVVHEAGFGNSYIEPVGSGTFLDLPYDCNGQPQGWRDPATVVVGSSDGGYALVQVGGDGTTAACTPLLPTADREITFARLRLDAQAMFITARGETGDEYYEVDLSTPGSEPVSVPPPPEMNGNWRIYHPRA
jgi:hypothetical protein